MSAMNQLAERAPKPSESGAELLVVRPEGLYCRAGDFYVDPSRAVARAVITHAHADHARAGHARYLCAAEGERVMRARLGHVALQTLAFGETVMIGDARVSLHPAGHVLGSAQVRIEHAGRIWVVSGDYRIEADRTCTAFEPVRCDVFVTESTFGLPVFRWEAQTRVFADIEAWWATNADQGRASVLFCYAFGKAQRVLAGVDPSIGPILCHGATQALSQAYRDSGIALPGTSGVDAFAHAGRRESLRRALVLAPPSAAENGWQAGSFRTEFRGESGAADNTLAQPS